MASGALFSTCRRYRYRLWRFWDPLVKPVLFIGLNPSTADEVENDPTVERMCRRAKEWKYGGLIVCNIFAIRGTDPKVIYKDTWPISEGGGSRNNIEIRVAAQESAIVICGWGTHGMKWGRGEEVLELLRKIGTTPYALKMNKRGTPAHPLYLSYSALPEPMISVTAKR